MKLPLLSLLAALMLAAVPAPAQTAARDLDTLLVDQRIKRMTTELVLTDEQKGKVRPLILDEVKAFKSYRADANLTEADRISKEKEFREASKPKFKAILTEEQFGKYEAMQKGNGAKKKAK